jgi:hypothetical protein
MIARVKQIADRRPLGRRLLAIIALPLVMLALRALPATIADEKSRVGNALIINVLCKPALLAIALSLFGLAFDPIFWLIPTCVETAVHSRAGG